MGKKSWTDTHLTKGDRCPCRAKQSLIDHVFDIQTAMEQRLDPEWAYLMHKLGSLL